MTREEALKQADELLLHLVSSGDSQIMDAVRSADGGIDHVRLVTHCMNARERLADRLMAEAKEPKQE